jgi:excisionase family DNA binding protein
VKKKPALLPSPAVSPVVIAIDPCQILTLSETAERLKVSERWVYEKSRRRCQNPLPTIRIGRYLRFDWTDVSAWLNEQKKRAV